MGIQDNLQERGKSDTSIAANMENLFQNHPLQQCFKHLDIEEFTNTKIQENNNVTPGPCFLSYRGDQGDYVVIGKLHYFRNAEQTEPDYSYFAYFNKCWIIVYVSTWTAHWFDQNKCTRGDDGNPIPVHCWWILDANIRTEEAFDGTMIHQIFCNRHKTGELNLISLAKIHNYKVTLDSNNDGGGKQPPTITPKKKGTKRSFSFTTEPLTVNSD